MFNAFNMKNMFNAFNVKNSMLLQLHHANSCTMLTAWCSCSSMEFFKETGGANRYV